MKKIIITITILLFLVSAAALKAEMTTTGNIFTVNTSLESVMEPSSASAPDGRTVVVWSVLNRDYTYDVKGRILSPGGSPVTDEFIVHSYTIGTQRKPLVSIWENGSFIVSWYGDGDSGKGFYFKTFDRNGTPVSGDIYACDYKSVLGAAALDNGTLVTAAGSFTGMGISLKKYSMEGVETGYTYSLSTGNVSDIIVKGSSSGSFALLYITSSTTGSKVPPKGGSKTSDIFVRYFGASGLVSSDIQLRTGYTGLRPALGINRDGAFVAVFAATDGFYASSYGITGELIEAEKLVLSYPADASGLPSSFNVSMNAEGYYSISWVQSHLDGSSALSTSLLEYNGTAVEGSTGVYGSSGIYESASGLSDKSLFNVWYGAEDTQKLYGKFMKSSAFTGIDKPADLIPIVQKMIEEKKIKRRGVGRRIIAGLEYAQRKLDRGKTGKARFMLKKLKDYISQHAESSHRHRCHGRHHRHDWIETAAANELKGYLDELIAGM